MPAATYCIVSIAILIVFIVIVGGIAWHLNEHAAINIEIKKDLTACEETKVLCNKPVKLPLDIE